MTIEELSSQLYNEGIKELQVLLRVYPSAFSLLSVKTDLFALAKEACHSIFLC